MSSWFVCLKGDFVMSYYTINLSEMNCNLGWVDLNLYRRSKIKNLLKRCIKKLRKKDIRIYIIRKRIKNMLLHNFNFIDFVDLKLAEEELVDDREELYNIQDACEDILIDRDCNILNISST